MNRSEGKIALAAVLMATVLGANAFAGAAGAVSPGTVEIVEAWREFDALRFARVDNVFRAFSGSSTVPTIEQRSELTQTQTGWLRSLEVRESVASDSSRRFTIRGANPGYSFVVKKNSSDNEWTLTDAVSTPNQMDKLPEDFGHDDFLLSLDSDSVLRLATLPHFRMTVEEATDNNVVVAISLDRDEQNKRTGTPIYGGKLTLDPRHYFVVKRAELDVAEGDIPLKKVIENEFIVENGVPLISSQTISVTLPDGSIHRTERVFEECSLDWAGDDGMFYLSHYGLPEPVETRAPGSYRTPNWLYWFIGGVLLTITGAFAIHRATRARTR